MLLFTWHTFLALKLLSGSLQIYTGSVEIVLTDTVALYQLSSLLANSTQVFLFGWRRVVQLEDLQNVLFLHLWRSPFGPRLILLQILIWGHKQCTVQICHWLAEIHWICTLQANSNTSCESQSMTPKYVNQRKNNKSSCFRSGQIIIIRYFWLDKGPES